MKSSNDKILILCSNYEPGGAQRAALRLTSELKAKNFSVELVFFHPKSEVFSDELPNFISQKRIQSIGEFIKFWKSLNQKIQSEKPDVVLTFLPFANIIGQIAAKLNGVRQRVASHRNVSKKEMSAPLRFLDYLCANFGIYSKVTAVSKSTKKSFDYYGKKAYSNIQVVNNGLNYKTSILSQKECRKKFKIPEDQFVLGNIGRMVDQKNQQLLIRILPFVKDAHLVIVGKGELKDVLLELASSLGVNERVQLIQEVSTTEMPDFYNAIDVFVMPSLFEGLSNALIEALAAGLPIISSDVDSQKDVIYREEDSLMAGILASNTDLTAWVNAVNLVKDNPDFKDQLCKKALKRSQDFTIEEMTQGFINSFDLNLKK